MRKLEWGFWKSQPRPHLSAKRRIHLGIDFGTSSSKIVFRDYGAPGGERAVLLLREGCPRIPSRVCVTRTDLLFGNDGRAPEDGEVYDSIKMQAAAEVTGNRNYYFGPVRAFPTKDGLSAADLTTLTVWYLISEGQRAVSSYLGKTEGVNLGMTMGVPMAFFNDKILRTFFLSVGRRGWQLFREEGTIGSTLAIAKASRCLRSRSGATLPLVPDDQVRDWVRSEGEAAMWWPFQSPAVATGPYTIIDIGAGTSHSSLYRIFGDGRAPKRGIAFLGAVTVTAGMDAVDRAIAECQGAGVDCLTLRGREQSILQSSEEARKAVAPVGKRIYEAYRKAWVQAYGKIQSSPAEVMAWRQHKMFTIGGGSLVPALVEPMRVHPSGANNQVCAVLLEPPQDLVRADGCEIHKHDLPFVFVAYGLSNIGLSIPEAFTPDEVPPMPEPFERRLRLDRDDIYAK